MEKLFISIVRMSISASYLITAVLLVRFLLQKAPKSMRSFLWFLVGIRLLIPFSIESVFSLIPNTQVADESIYDMQQPEIKMMPESTGITAPVSRPSQNVLIPSLEKSVTKTQMAVTLCAKAWFFGLVCMTGYMLISWLRLKNRVKTSVPMNVSLDCGTVKIYQSDSIESPFLFGIISPRIYIPSPIADEELPYVIIHEMTHKKRKDYLIKPIGFLLLSVYWFNPFVWIAYIMLCKDIELICDEHVIKKLGASCKKEYSQALLNSAVNRRMVTSCPVAFGEISVKERVKNVLKYKKPAFWVLVAAVLACIIVPICFMTQKKTEAPELADTPEQTDFRSDVSLDEIPSEDFNLDDLFSVSGEYEMINPDPDKYNTPDLSIDMLPRLYLQENGQFSFGYDPLSSYLCMGEYDLTGDKLQAVTEDGKYHYQFTQAGDGSLLIFDAENSSDVSRIDAEKNPMPPVENGSVFVRNNAKTALNDAAAFSQTLNQELAQGTTMTAEALKEKLELLQEMKMRLIHEEMKLKRQVEKLKDIALNQKEKAALESVQQERVQQLETAVKRKEEEQAALQSVMDASKHSDIAYKTMEQWAQAFCDRDGDVVASQAPYIVTGENVDAMITEDAKQLEALFPNHHEFASKMDFPKMIDLNGDGVEEKIEMVNLLYNGGDGGYALKVTDTKTGKLIPLPDGYTEESGFPIFSSFMLTEGRESWLQIQLGNEKKCNTLATMTQDALIRIYERNNMYKEIKENLFKHSNDMIVSDAISGCNIVTYKNEETPVIILKSYLSGFAGHADTLGYVITELRLQKDNTWAYRHYFLLDSCDDPELSWQIGVEDEEIEADRNNGISILPFDKKSDINFQLLLPKNS